MGEKVSYELTNPQKSIWNMEEFFKGTTINNICAPDIIYEKINAKVLEKALNNIVRKNDSFRIQIELQNGVPMQYIAEYKPFEIEVVHIKNEEDVKEIEKEGINYKFELINSSLYHFKIFIMENGCGGFVITAHHLISDSWSMGLVARQVIQEYHALKNNEELDEIETSYVQYIEAEREYKKSKKYEIDKLYWNEMYKDIPEQAIIPGSKKSFKSFSCDGKRNSFWLNKEIVQKMNAFCTSNKISAFNFLMAIYSIYLGRVSNLDDFVIGTPILNRANYKEKQTMGMFINTVPVRINTKGEENFASFSRLIGKNMMGILKHQKYSYNQILEDLRNRNANIPNLYNVMISYQITKAFSKEYGDYKTDWIFNGYVSDDLDIHITDLNDTGELKVSYDYLIDKYTEKDIENMHKRIIYMINQVLDNEEILTGELEIVTEEERDRILNDFNNTKVDYPKDKTIVDLFEEQVEKTPDNIAVVFEDKKLTYKELNEKANSLARYLVEQGVKENNVVSILLKRSLKLIIAIYAVIKSGASYVLIDPELPEERINYIIKDSGAKDCITKRGLGNLQSEERLIYIDEMDLTKFDKKNLPNKVITDDLCIIYTSGSTGNPKAVLLHKHGLINLVYGFDKAIEISKFKSILGIATVSFDMFAVELYCSTLFGNTLILANEEEQKNPIAMSNLIRKYNVDFLLTTPSRIELLLLDECGKPLKDLKTFLLGGEKVTENLYKRLLKATDAKIFNGYGPTEITACCTTKLLNSKEITIGNPTANTQVYICDKNMKLLPIGIIGEICVAGVGVANGYLNNKEATSKNFVKNPFGDGYIYKTGDLGKYKDNGEIEYIGRFDFQVKIRGLRIELGEIEKRIAEFPNIKSCVVIKKGDNLSHEYLCAYFKAENKVNNKELRSYLEKVLPKYMVPQYIIEITDWPYSHNGKIDTKNLPEPQKEINNTDIILPRNEIDAKLIDILKEILNTEVISIKDSFFELGGDSLSAINLSVKIKSVFNADIFVRDILDNPIISDISDIIVSSINNKEEKSIKKIENAEYYELSSAQKRIYYASKVAGEETTLYNTPGGVIFEEDIDAAKLENCLNTLIKRHEALRTYFEVIDENVVQKISDNISFKLEIVENQKYEDIDNIFKEFVKPFDLSKAPLFRTKFVRFTNKKSAIFIDMHHIISDGTSMNIFTDELCKLYNGEELQKIDITYKDYAAYEKEEISKGKLKEAEKYWVQKFEGDVPVLNMPVQYQRPAVQSFEGNKVYSIINTDEAKQIEELSKTLGITPYMMLLSVYYILLSKYSSEEDIVVGTPVIGRDIAEVQNVIGMFVNTLALREKIDSKLTYKEFAMKVKENLLNSYKYQTYPFDELVNKLNIKRDTSRNPLFDTMFIYQNEGYKEIKLEETKGKYYTPDTNISKFDISLELVPNKEGIKLTYEYATKLFKEEFIQRFAKHYINIIKEILENEEVKICNISMLSEEEKKQILYEFNSTETDYEKEKSITEVFEEQVEKEPDRIAVVFEDNKLTYKELNEKANSLAHYLRKNGISRNDLVGIMVNRSLEMIISILAVLKAGGAYIPIDPTYPKERIEYMLNSSKAKLLLTFKALEDKVKYDNKLYVDLDNEDLYNLSNDNLNSINTPEDLAYVIFTSGSTGLPKGVKLMHKNINNFIKGMMDKLEFRNNETIVSITTISFDIFVLESLLPLQNGMKVIIANEKEQTNVKLFNELCLKNKVDIMQTTASRMQAFISNNEYTEFLKNMKSVLIGGEPFPQKLLTELKQITHAKIFNMYGPTETAVWSTMQELTNTDEIDIGKPIANTEVYVLDKDLNPLPYGVSGELYISGEGVSKGYLNNEEAMAKSFIKNPFVKDALMYKTGDLCALLENGNIKYLERIDNQVKIRGLRIELGEIETLILKYPNIKKAVVIKQKIQNREFISAYFLSNKRIVINELRKYLSHSLPRYMVPSYFVALENFPYTPNGKIDKKALPLPNEILKVSEETYIPPKTELEKKLVRIWEKVLNTSPIGINDNFFELGGDSILAMNLNIELMKITNRINYADIFRFPTIVEQEEKINSNDDSLMFSKIENLSDNYVYVLKNTKRREKIQTWHPKNVLLTGGTGFLGIHILDEFIKNEIGNIYCIVREEPGLTAEAKLHEKLNYYFGNKYDDLIGKRIFAVTGNITKSGFGLNQEELLELANSVDVVINSAARVAHYGNYDDFYNANVKSVKYIIDFCNSFRKKLYHISTMSVSGADSDYSYLSNISKKKKKKEIVFDESSLYVGQILDNVYTRSKFEAESYVLNAISRGLDGYILRMGNLMPRFRDGLFQENILDNAFTNRFEAFIKIGVIPEYMLYKSIEFTPVDYAAEAVYKIITHPTYRNRIFHLYNHKNVIIERYIKVLKKAGYDVKIVSESEFKEQINTIMQNDELKDLLKSLINDFNRDLHLDYKNDIIITSNFTIKYLRKIHFKWHRITNRYLIRFINLLKKVV